MKKRKLVLDFDNTLVDTSKAFIKAYQYLFAYEGVKDYCTLQWNFKDVIPNITTEEIHNVFGSTSLFVNMKPYFRVITIVNSLCKHTEVYICSIGSSDNISNKMEFIELFFPNCKFIPIIQNQTEVTMDKSIINMEGCVLVDDHPSNLKSSNADIKVLYKHRGLDYAWSKDFKIGDSCNHIATVWNNEFYEYLLNKIYYK